MQELKRLGILSTAKVGALFGVVIGLLSVILSKIVCANSEAAAFAGMQLQCEVLTPAGMLLGVFSAVVGYFLVGLIGAALYNLFASWIGGVKVELGKAKK